MPCDQIKKQYETFTQNTGDYDMEFSRKDPIARALRDLARQRGYLDKITGYLMVGSMEFAVLIDGGRRMYFDLVTDPDLHELAFGHVHGPGPGEPPSFAYLQAEVRYNPERPRDLLNVPLKETARKWKRVVSVDPTVPDHFEKEYYVVEQPVASTLATVKKRYVRVVEVEEVMPSTPVRVERIVEEEEASL